MTHLPQHIADEIEEHLNAIAALFKPGAKLTLLVRPEVGPDQDADLLMTTDTFDQIFAAIERRQKLAEVSGT